MELTCYVLPGWTPRLRPAAARRDWMDATPVRYAYRCLPLAIANAHGWEIGSACGFRARWTGGADREAIEIEVDDPATIAAHRPVSLFGSGTLTFHVDAVLRTPPGWNLLVGGPPNAAKDGLAPLSGVIETDWSPYTFTMNWRFTRANEWVRFDEDEPFCFFMPVERGVLERVRPVIRPMAEAPELEAAYTAWSASREAFHEHIRETRPQVPADQWQKFYFRGHGPGGEPGPADHETRLRVSPFAQATEARCPVRAPAIIEEPPAVPAPRGSDALASLMRTIGIDTAAERAATLSGLAGRLARASMAPLRPAGVEPPTAWFARAAERQRALSPLPTSVPRLRALPADAFLDLVYAAGRPMVIEGLDLDAVSYCVAPGERAEEADATSTPLVQARENRLVGQVAGRARVRLLPPAAHEAQGLTVEVEPGDALFVPVGWWLQRHALIAGITLTCTAFLWPNGAIEGD